MEKLFEKLKYLALAFLSDQQQHQSTDKNSSYVQKTKKSVILFLNQKKKNQKQLAWCLEDGEFSDNVSPSSSS